MLLEHLVYPVTYIIIFLILAFLINHLLNKTLKSTNRYFLFKRHDEIIANYENAKIMAFEIIRINDITRLKTNDYFKMTSDEIDNIRSKFISLAIKELISGETRNDIIEIKGSLDSVMNDLSAYFNIKMIEEDIRTTENKIDNGELIENVEI